MVERQLWALFSTGAVDNPPKPAKIDYAAHAAIAQKAAEDSLVLLKNEGGLLPLKGVATLAVIGGHADVAVLSGGGSSAVTPVGGNPLPHEEPRTWPGPVMYLPSSPVAALKAELPHAKIAFDSGQDIAAAVALAKQSDVAIVFVTKWNGEGFDAKLELDGNQDALVEAVAAANPRTIVVVESGGAILMPWAGRVPVILEAFYPGIRGGNAIARILTGKVNPSGHLPISFPASNDQLAHATIPGFGKRDGIPVHVTYDEGAAIGYKYYDVKGTRPLFAFGHGLSYTSFALSAPAAQIDGNGLRLSVTLRNTGKLAGKGVVQAYVAPADWQAVGWEAPKRLGAFGKVDLKPGEARSVELTVDPRLLATWEAASNAWTIRAGTYHVLFGQASDELPTTVDITLPEASWSAANPGR
jgi:beta-glucosidase